MELTKREVVIKLFSKDTLGIQSEEEIWYNFNKDLETKAKTGVQKLFDTLNKGDTIELFADFQKRTYNGFVVLKKAEKKSGWQEEITTLKDLLKQAHIKGLKEIITEIITIDLEKKYALFKAIVIGYIDEKKVIIGSFQGHGDVTSENIGSEAVKRHWIR
ncbi:MAG: hypothetical protein IIB81_03255 [Nanoarchaeota archaeon]|nr:hypothetical protein [Nanoarchaeota archaeon]